jgi:hypothetical protein
MSKCAYCRQRKGKRACPALNGLICSQCCGEHRMVRITCPADCTYLESSSEYQEHRIGEQFAQARRDFYKGLFEQGGEKAAALFNLIEVVSFSYFQGRRDGQDAEVIAAMQALRRSLSPLHIPGAPGQMLFAEHLKKEYETFAKQQTEGGKAQHALDQQTATDVLDRGMAFITEFSGKEFQSRRFLMGLIGYIKTAHPEIAAHLVKQREGGRIVLASDLSALTPPPTGPMPSGLQHTHGPGCQHHHH